MKYILIFLLLISGKTIIFAQNLEALSYDELDSLKFLNLDKRAFDLALPYALAAESKAKKEFTEKDSIYVVKLEDLGHLYGQISEFDKAEPLLIKAMTLGEKVFGEKNKTYTNFVYNLAQLYHDKGQYELAESYYLKDIGISKEIIGTQTAEYATTISNLALLYYDMGQYERCEALNLEAIEIRKKTIGEKNMDFATSLNNLASVYFQMGKYDQVEKLFLQVKEIFGEVLGRDHQHYGSTLNNLAYLYMSMESYEKAEPLYLESIAIFKKILSERHPHYLKLLNNLAMLYTYIGDYEESERLYFKVLKLRSKVLGETHPDYAYSLNNLGALYARIGEKDKAEFYYKKGLAVFEKALGTNHPAYFGGLNNLADYYVSSNQLKKAEECLALVIRMNSKSEMIDSLQLKTSLNSIASYEFYSNSELSETLKNYYRYALASQAVDSSSNSFFLEYAYSSLQGAMQLNEKIRNNLGVEEDKLRVLGEMSGLVQRAIVLGLELSDGGTQEQYTKEIFSYAEQNKSMLLADAIKGNSAKSFSQLPEKMVIGEQELQNRKKELEKAAIEAKDESTKRSVIKQQSDLNLEIITFLKELKQNYPEYHQLKYENITAKVKDIQLLLDTKSMALEYFVADTATYLFAITKDELKLIVIPQSKIELNKNVADLRRALSNYKFILEEEKAAYDLYTRKAAFFYDNYIKKVLIDKTGIENLIIVTDGELGHLPFEVFLVEPANQSMSGYQNLHYLVNDFNISYNYSMTLWRENLTNKTKQNKYSKGILACSASYPVIDSANLSEVRSASVARLRSQLKPLTETTKEVDRLESMFVGTFLRAAETNETYFKNNANKYNVIHLAMHGILDSKLPILSSLAFTDDLDTLEDNFLQAYEISNLKLNADLVVLSACETGYGQFRQGEGVVSLARSFMYAGVSSLVVSLWQVNDFSTALIMEEFYMNLSDGLSKDVALKNAKLAYIKRAEGMAGHPAYWSPFIQLGNSQPIEIYEKTNYTMWLLGLGGLLVVIGGFYWKGRQQKVA